MSYYAYLYGVGGALLVANDVQFQIYSARHIFIVWLNTNWSEMFLCALVMCEALMGVVKKIAFLSNVLYGLIALKIDFFFEHQRTRWQLRTTAHRNFNLGDYATHLLRQWSVLVGNHIYAINRLRIPFHKQISRISNNIIHIRPVARAHVCECVHVKEIRKIAMGKEKCNIYFHFRLGFGSRLFASHASFSLSPFLSVCYQYHEHMRACNRLSINCKMCTHSSKRCTKCISWIYNDQCASVYAVNKPRYGRWWTTKSSAQYHEHSIERMHPIL